MLLKMNTIFALCRGVMCTTIPGTPRIATRFSCSSEKKSRYNLTNADITLTCVAYLFDALFKDGTVCAYKSDINRQIYAEIEGVPFATDGKTIWSLRIAGPRRYFYALALWNAVYSDNEANDTLKKAINGYLTNGFVNANDAFRFCDNFYYCMVKDKPDMPAEEIVISEYEAAMRSGELQPIPELEGVKMAECSIGTPVKRKKQKIESVSFRDMYPKKNCLKGDYKIPYAWSAEAAENIPKMSLLNQYVPSDEYYKILNKCVKRLTEKVVPRVEQLTAKYGPDYDRIEAIGDDYINLTLCGKPGTGKSIMVHALAATLGMPLYVVNNSQNTDEDTYEGMTKMVDGKPTAVPTDVVKAFKYGGICLLEEINLPQAAVVMGALGQAVEFPFILKEDGYKTIRRHPLCVFISTMNTGAAGSKTVSQPFASRFKQSYRISDPTKEEFIKILMSRTGASKRLCSWVYTCYNKLVGVVKENPMADVDTILMTLSLRCCIGAIENIQEGYNPKEAIADSMIGKIAENDLIVAASCDEVLSSAIPDLILV